MINVTEDLPKKMQKRGCTLHMQDSGKFVKYVLEDKLTKYRAFIYVNTSVRDRDGYLKDLLNNYYYAHGMGTIADGRGGRGH